jgi:outer membrane protein TolC
MAEEQVKQTQNAWQSAQVGLAELLRSRDQLLTLKIARLSALRDWHLAWIQHQSAVGTQFNK